MTNTDHSHREISPRPAGAEHRRDIRRRGRAAERHYLAVVAAEARRLTRQLNPAALTGAQVSPSQGC